MNPLLLVEREQVSPISWCVVVVGGGGGGIGWVDDNDTDTDIDTDTDSSPVSSSSFSSQAKASNLFLPSLASRMKRKLKPPFFPFPCVGLPTLPSLLLSSVSIAIVGNLLIL